MGMMKMVPQFLLADENGRALAAALDTLMSDLGDAISGGLGILLDPDKMPEWRLDEVARERNCLYDFSASIERKRLFVKEAVNLYRTFGTPSALDAAVVAAFGEGHASEWFEYGGKPHHFGVVTEGLSTREGMEYFVRVAERVQRLGEEMERIEVLRRTPSAIPVGGAAIQMARPAAIQERNEWAAEKASLFQRHGSAANTRETRAAPIQEYHEWKSEQIGLAQRHGTAALARETRAAPIQEHHEWAAEQIKLAQFHGSAAAQASRPAAHVDGSDAGKSEINMVAMGGSAAFGTNKNTAREGT